MPDLPDDPELLRALVKQLLKKERYPLEQRIALSSSKLSVGLITTQCGFIGPLFFPPVMRNDNLNISDASVACLVNSANHYSMGV